MRGPPDWRANAALFLSAYSMKVNITIVNSTLDECTIDIYNPRCRTKNIGHGLLARRACRSEEYRRELQQSDGK